MKLSTQSLLRGVAIAICAGAMLATSALAQEPALLTPADTLPIETELTEVTSDAVHQPTLANPLIAESTETIRERYPSGEVRIERQVMLDNDQNYVNHGPWKMFDLKGNVIADGQYEMGRRTGVWTKWHGRGSSQMLSTFPFNRFKAPYITTASYTEGVVDGHLLIMDSEDRKVMQLSIEKGKRHGMAITWLPTGKILRQATYEHGLPVGEVLEIKNGSTEAERVATYIGGRKVVSKKINFPRSQQAQSEELFLAPKTVQKTSDDFWNLTLAEFEQKGEEKLHGLSRKWHPNGQLRSEGMFSYGKRVGKFMSWHANGQLSAEGNFENDLYAGKWIWWHANGQKAAIGTYQAGNQLGQWLWWEEDGQLTRRMAFDGTSSNLDETRIATEPTLKLVR